MDRLITKLYQTEKTVFTTKQLALLWAETNQNNLKAKISYYVRQGSLTRITRGVFAKSERYDPRELATSIYSPCYISFETALRDAGIIFQYYETIFVAGPWSKSLITDSHPITFRKLKKSILYSVEGVMHSDRYSIASPERAFLDTLYLFPNYYFDNLRSINWERCIELVELYQNKELRRRLMNYKIEYAE